MDRSDPMAIVSLYSQKGTKNAQETARTFATMLANVDFRQRLMSAHGEEEFVQLVTTQMQQLTDAGSQQRALEIEEESLVRHPPKQPRSSGWHV